MALVEQDVTEFVGRGLVPGLATSKPLTPTLPALLQEDPFVDRLMVAFDEAMAPILSTLDCFDTYLDPMLAPDDFVEWLAGWVGIEIDQAWTDERVRRLVADAARIYRLRGTAVGMVDNIELYAGVRPEIDESGACGWSSTADTPLPGSADPHLTVRLRVDAADAVKVSTVRRIVAASRPAHLPFEVEVRTDAGELHAGNPDLGLGIGSAGPAEGATISTEAGGATGQTTKGAGPVAPPGSERIDLAPSGPTPVEEVEGAPGLDTPVVEGEDPEQ